MRTYNDLTVIEYDKARDNVIQGGYKYLIKGRYLVGYTAFKTARGFNDWLQRSNLKLEFKDTSVMYRGEEKTTAHIYEAKGTIEESSFWKKEELPENAVLFKGLSNGSLVDCYYVHTASGSKIYRPNPNAKEVYNPLPVSEHLELIKTKG